MITFRDIQRILTMVCDESSRLASDAYERKLTWVERIGMYAHIMLCKPCKRLHKQLRLLHEINAAYRKDHSFVLREANTRLTEDAKLRIKEKSRPFS